MVVTKEGEYWAKTKEDGYQRVMAEGMYQDVTGATEERTSTGPGMVKEGRSWTVPPENRDRAVYVNVIAEDSG